MRVLITEDDRHLSEALTQILSEAGYETVPALDGYEGLELASGSSFDVMILDIMLPGLNGFEVLSEIRKQDRHLPILMLTARNQVPDKVKALDGGADDYLTKPFIPEELLARLRALTRRSGENALVVYRFGDIELDADNHELRCGEKKVMPGYKEFELLRYLILNSRMITSKEILLTKVWGADAEVDENSVEAYISFLRKKLAYIGSAVTIRTVRKVGYQLEERSEQ